MSYMVQLDTAFFGSMGFSIIFNLRKEKLVPASIGGMFSWGVYLYAETFLSNDALCYVAAAFALTIYAEIMARCCKTPATLLLVAATIPLIPGGSLYKTMCYLIEGNTQAFMTQGVYTLLLAVALAGGILCAMTVWRLIAKCTRAAFMQRN
ncbi:MAG: threonine/serine exporter family protein [Clostridiales bacterium]|nr:threonine/serine exporter family protein [Clostridiales bacterium]